MSREKITFVMVKPDGVRRELVGECIKRFEQRGLKIAALKVISNPTREQAEDHYTEHRGDDDFFNTITGALLEGPMVAIVLKGPQAPRAAREVIGYPSPIGSPAGTLRFDYALEEPFNVIHGSNSQAEAMREMKIWFKDDPQIQDFIENFSNKRRRPEVPCNCPDCYKENFVKIFDKPQDKPQDIKSLLVIDDLNV